MTSINKKIFEKWNRYHIQANRTPKFYSFLRSQDQSRAGFFLQGYNSFWRFEKVEMWKIMIKIEDMMYKNEIKSYKTQLSKAVAEI